ncbi:MAG: LCP family protein [Candidatus Muiribacteriota bacterium]|jgi:LCP family protein required for cell wall assembly
MKKLIENKAFIKIFITLVILVTVVSAVSYYFYFYEKPSKKSNLISLGRAGDLGKMIFLILGTDNDIRGRSRSDTIILAFVNTYTKKIQILSIPRDTMVEIEGRGTRKINAAYVYGGIKGTEEAIEKLLNIEIDHYVVVDIDGFVNIIDILGGIEIDVEEDMHYIDKAGELYINLKKGTQVLDGRNAMYYVRFRDKISADIGRIGRQQKFIKQVMEKTKEIGLIWKLPSIIQELYRNIKTDLGIKDILNVVKRFRDFDFSQVKVDMLPGQPDYIDKVSYYVTDIEKTEETIEEIMRYKADTIEKEKELKLEEEKNEIHDTEEVKSE